MGFISYRRHRDGVRLFLDCTDGEEPGSIDWNYPVDVVFNEPGGLRFEGVTDMLALKRLYELVSGFEAECAKAPDMQRALLSADNFERFLAAQKAREMPIEPWRVPAKQPR